MHIPCSNVSGSPKWHTYLVVVSTLIPTEAYPRHLTKLCYTQYAFYDSPHLSVWYKSNMRDTHCNVMQWWSPCRMNVNTTCKILHGLSIYFIIVGYSNMQYKIYYDQLQQDFFFCIAITYLGILLKVATNDCWITSVQIYTAFNLALNSSLLLRA